LAQGALGSANISAIIKIEPPSRGEEFLATDQNQIHTDENAICFISVHLIFICGKKYFFAPWRLGVSIAFVPGRIGKLGALSIS
jgi:hypothetical protein